MRNERAAAWLLDAEREMNRAAAELDGSVLACQRYALAVQVYRLAERLAWVLLNRAAQGRPASVKARGGSLV